MTDRVTHAKMAGGDEIVRLNRAGKWYRESEGCRYPISLSEAVRLATLPGSTVYIGRSGGRAFDARVAQASAPSTEGQGRGAHADRVGDIDA